ncbi:MAG: twin-arginine translocase TatA/TatE family subunit [Puniceicoccaceae bacterium]|nr:MAG: twin-arginine translocase TatA/TatE family subunit [Puniceicoccaceae bacterium]
MPAIPTAFIQSLGWTEVVLILFLVLLLFGARRLPELARSFGKSIKEFKKATSEIEDDIRSAIEDEDEKPRIPKKSTLEKPVARSEDRVPAKKESEH